MGTALRGPDGAPQPVVLWTAFFLILDLYALVIPNVGALYRFRYGGSATGS